MLTEETLRKHAALKKELSSIEEQNPILKYDPIYTENLGQTPYNPQEAVQSTQQAIQESYFVSTQRFLKELASSNSKIEELNKKYEEFTEKSTELNKNYKKLSDDNSTLSTNYTDLKKEFDASRAGSIEALVVFVAFFTLVAVNITIFTKVEYLSSALWFMFLMTLCLTIVILIFSMLVRNEFSKWKFGSAITLIAVIIFSLIYLNHSYNQNDIIINPRPDPTATPVPPTIVPTITPTPTLIFPLRRLTPTG